VVRPLLPTRDAILSLLLPPVVVTGRGGRDDGRALRLLLPAQNGEDQAEE